MKEKKQQIPNIFCIESYHKCQSNGVINFNLFTNDEGKRGKSLFSFDQNQREPRVTHTENRSSVFNLK